MINVLDELGCLMVCVINLSLIVLFSFIISSPGD